MWALQIQCLICYLFHSTDMLLETEWIFTSLLIAIQVAQRFVPASRAQWLNSQYQTSCSHCNFVFYLLGPISHFQVIRLRKLSFTDLRLENIHFSFLCIFQYVIYWTWIQIYQKLCSTMACLIGNKLNGLFRLALILHTVDLVNLKQIYNQTVNYMAGLTACVLRCNVV